MDLVETLIEDARWADVGLTDLAERAARAALADLGLGHPALSNRGFQIGLLAALMPGLRF